RLIATDLRCEVRFEFTQGRSAPDADRIACLLKEPPIENGSDPLPYHLDSAHAFRLARCAAGSRVLELGCGGGQGRSWMQSHGLWYIGTDLSKTRVFEWLRQSGGPDLLSDAHFLPFEDQQFDVVYAAALFEHVACPQRVVQEAHRVLKPGGIFLANC